LKWRAGRRAPAVDDCHVSFTGKRLVAPRFASFREFYPHYLALHSNRTSRRLHLGGTALALVIAAVALVSRHWPWLLLAPLAGYLPAWVGHFFFERNSPATFRHPLYSLGADFRLLAEVLTGRARW
jgi:hypothetical protein